MKKRGLILMAFITAAMLSACTREPKLTEVHPGAVVVVTTPVRGPVARTIALPGDLAGYYQSTLYAKVTGYLKTISVDKGDWVNAGQVLAEIEVPELKQRLDRARADLEIARVTYQRLEQVWKSDPRLIARQDVDVAWGKFQAAKAQADELSALVGYTRIIAPFAGVITGRFVDPGALIRSGGGQAGQSDGGSMGGGATAIVSEAMIDTMRIYVYVPEGVVGLVRRGVSARFTLQDFPGRVFHGTVTRFSTSLDLSTRTMLTEVDIQNPRHELYPGMYANVTLELERHPDAIKLRDSAIAAGPDGSFVYVVRGGVVRRVPVITGISDGRYVEIVSGLKGGEQVVAVTDPGLSEGEVVKSVMERPSSLNDRGTLADNR